MCALFVCKLPYKRAAGVEGYAILKGAGPRRPVLWQYQTAGGRNSYIQNRVQARSLDEFTYALPVAHIPHIVTLKLQYQSILIFLWLRDGMVC